MRRTPMLRGRVTRLNGQTARPETVSENGRWILRGDRGVTWSRELPEGEFLVAGKWWPTDYSGKPLVSMAKRNAAALAPLAYDYHQHTWANVADRKLA